MMRVLGAVAASRGAALDPDAQLYINAMTTPPNAARQTVINQLFLDLKAAGVYTLLDELWLLAAHHSQASLLGIKRYKDCLAVNAPTFETDRGWNGDATKYINTGFVPVTDGVNYTLNDASLGAYIRTATPEEISVAIGGTGGSGNDRGYVSPHRSSGSSLAQVHEPDGAIVVATNNGLGFWVGRRPSSSSQRLLRNGVEIGSNAFSSSALPPVAYFIIAYNNAGVPVAPDLRQHSIAFVGAAMTATQQLGLFTSVETYLDAIGAGVVP